MSKRKRVNWERTAAALCLGICLGQLWNAPFLPMGLKIVLCVAYLLFGFWFLTKIKREEPEPEEPEVMVY
ncbi:MAG: hypothetical protein QXR42_08035 [Candidatus Bathyarchaeia archaeon]